MSFEQQRSPEGLPFDLAEAQRLLGYSVQPSLGFELVYDERLVICERALAAKENMRATLGSAARAAGFEATPTMLQNWEPDDRQLETIHAQLGRERKRARAADGLTQFITDGRMTNNAFGTPLRAEQQQMILDTEFFLTAMPRTYDWGGKGGVISGPPGIGKTGVINALCAGLKYNEDPKEPLRILVLENTQNVMHQTHGQAGDRGFGRFAPHLDVGLRYADRKDLEHDIVIMPFASFNLLMERGEMPDFDVVIGDEGDVYATGTTGANLRKYVDDKTLIITTATPDEATYKLAPHDIYTMSLPNGIHDGLLAPTTGLVLRTHRVIDGTTLPSDPLERQALRANNLRANIEDAKLRVKEAVEKGVGVLIHCPAGNDIEIARILAEELRDIQVVVPNYLGSGRSSSFRTIPRNIRAIEVGGKKQMTATGRRLQQTIYHQYRKSDIDVLVFVKAVGRGDDFPDAKLVIDLESRSVRGWRDVVQLGGRGMRLVTGENGKPVPATWICYHDPLMKDQFTSVMALGGDAGQDVMRVTQQGRTVSTLPLRRLQPVLMADPVPITTETFDRIDVVHREREQIAPDQLPDHPMDEVQLARYLLVGSITVRQMLGRMGKTPGEVVDRDELEILLEYYPDLRPMPLPKTGYVSATDLVTMVGRSDVRTIPQLRWFARRHGMLFGRFIAEGGQPDFYATDAQANQLLTLLYSSSTLGL